MNRKDKVGSDYPKKEYKIFKGYTVKPKSEKKKFTEHFVVPWELTEKSNKEETH